MYRFISGSLPVEYKPFLSSLYSAESHRLLQSAQGWCSFHVVDEKKKVEVASCHLHVYQGIARSPYRAPFGGIELGARISKNVISEFVLHIESHLRRLDVTKIIFKLPSRAIKTQDGVEVILLKSGFQLELSEVASIIPVSKDFRKHLHESERKRLNKSIRAGLVAEPLPLSKIKDVYHFIKACRTRKNYEISMSWAEMEKLAKAFPENVLLFAVKNADEIIAAAICIKVNQRTLYDFYHDHSAKYDQYSPVVMLVNEIHHYAMQHKFVWIDLGTSMIGDQINIGLHRFKLRLGAKPALKNSLIKVLT